MNVIPFANEGDPTRRIDFDFYVDLLVCQHGFSRRDAEVEARKECRRDNLTVVRSGGIPGYDHSKQDNVPPMPRR
jgi:hypothetical protein